MPPSKPWYREPWPWLLMTGPAAVVVAGAITTVIAVKTADPVIADDYYKQGLAVNRVLAKESAAEALGIRATLQFNGEGDRVRVLVAANDALPKALQLTLVHPTRAGDDRSIALVEESRGVYRGTLAPLKAAAYQFQLQDTGGTWRLSGRWHAAS